MNKQSEREFVSEAKGLAKFFELKIDLKLFGQLVWTWTFPPKK